MVLWMKEGPHVNFVIREAWNIAKRFSEFTRRSSVFYTSMRNKQENIDVTINERPEKLYM